MGEDGVEKPHRGKALFKCPVIKAHAHREQVTEGIKAVELTSSRTSKRSATLTWEKFQLAKVLHCRHLRGLAFSPTHLENIKHGSSHLLLLC